MGLELVDQHLKKIVRKLGGQGWEQQQGIQEDPYIEDCEENQTYVLSGNDSPKEAFPQELKWCSDESSSSRPTGYTEDLMSERMEASGWNEGLNGLNELIRPKALVEESGCHEVKIYAKYGVEATVGYQ